MMLYVGFVNSRSERRLSCPQNGLEGGVFACRGGRRRADSDSSALIPAE